MDIHLQDDELTQGLFDKVKELRNLIPLKIDELKVFNSQSELLMETYMDRDVSDEHEVVVHQCTWYNKSLLDEAKIKYC